MCAIIGVAMYGVKPSDLELIKKIFIESQIRGKHATGISYLNSKKEIVTFIHAGPAEEFVEIFDFNNLISDRNTIEMIGHCRYSTSDLGFNQPLVDKENTTAIVHNGVASQSSPEEWFELYGIKCETRNDSELLLHSLENMVNRYPSSFWDEASIAMISLCSSGLSVYRNGKRPMYEVILDNGYAFVSTKDIATRCKLNAHRTEMKPLNSIDFQPE